MTICKLRALLVLALISLSACASLRTDDAMQDVRAGTAQRLGKNVALGMKQADVDARIAQHLKHPLTADSAVEIALLNNRRLRATLEDVGISQANLLEARTLKNPSLAASFRFSNAGGGPNHEFSLAGDVLDLLLLPLRSKMAAHEHEQTKRRVSHEVLELAASTKAAFYTVQAHEQFAKKLMVIAEVGDATGDFAKRLHDAGNINDLELLQQQAGGSETQLALKHAQADIAAAHAKLNRLLGLADQRAHWSIASALPSLPKSDPMLSRVEALALKQRQDLAAAHEHVKAVGRTLQLKRRTRLIPGVNLGVDTEREVEGRHLTGPTLDFELPIFNWGKAGVMKLEAEFRQAQAEAEALDAEVRNDVQAAHAALRAAREACEFQSGTMLPQRQKILGQSLLHYNAMQKSNFELLMAKTDEQRAEKEFIESLRDYWIARAELEKAAGGTLNRNDDIQAVRKSVRKPVEATPMAHHQHH